MRINQVFEYRSIYFGKYMILFMRIRIKTLEISTIIIAFLTEKEIKTVLAHVTVLKNFRLAPKTLVFFLMLNL